MERLRKMSEEEKRLFGLLKKAVFSERDAQSLYQEALSLCKDPILALVLEGFYEDEKRHERAVLARYHQFRMDFELEEGPDGVRTAG